MTSSTMLHLYLTAWRDPLHIALGPLLAAVEQFTLSRFISESSGNDYTFRHLAVLLKMKKSSIVRQGQGYRMTQEA